MSDGRGAHRTAACLDSGRGGCSNRCVPRRRSGETARRLVVLALCALAAGVLAVRLMRPSAAAGSSRPSSGPTGRTSS